MGIYIFAPLARRAVLARERGSTEAMADGDEVEVSDEWAAYVCSMYEGRDGNEALVPVIPTLDDDAAEISTAELSTAELSTAELSTAERNRAAAALGYDGPKRKADVLAFLAGFESEAIMAALADE